MSPRAPRMALLAALALFGCSDRDRSSGEEVVAAAVQECLSPAEDALRASCVDAWAAGHPQQAVAFAARFARGTPPSPALALRALRAAPDSDEKQALRWEIARIALSQGMLAEAEESLTPREDATPPAPPRTATRKAPPYPGAPPDAGAPSGAADMLEAAGPMLAELREKQGRFREAYELHARLAERDPTAEAHVVKAVQMLGRHAKGEAILEYCRSLQEGSRVGSGAAVQPRPLQVLACLREGLNVEALSPKAAEPMVLDELAAIPALRLEELRRLAPAGLHAAEAAATCTAKGVPAAAAGKGEAWPGREAAVHMRLAEGEEDEAVRLCYLRLAQGDCLDGLEAGKRCSNLWSFGMYLQLLAKLHKDQLGSELTGLIDSDKGLQEISKREQRRLVDMKRMHRGLRGLGGKENEKVTQILTALCDIHLVLANVLTTQQELAQGTGVLSPAYHVKRWQDLWGELWPGKALPDEMLSEEARKLLVRPQPVRRDPPRGQSDPPRGQVVPQ